MEEINIIHRNEFGLAFYWKDRNKKIQVVFRNTGFYLNLAELKSFQQEVLAGLAEGCCKDCNLSKKCKSLLLKTPSEKIDLAVSLEELEQINDLLGGTIFRTELHSYKTHWAN